MDALTERVEQRRRDQSIDRYDAKQISQGVTVGWLAEVFDMDPKTVKKRLAECVPLHRRKDGYIYSLRQASAYLVKPVFDVVRYLSNMKPSELPPQLQKEFWDGQLKRQLWEERAGDLWRTTKVLEVLSEMFLTIKSTMQLWSEDVEREVGLTEDQRKVLIRLADELQNEIQLRLTTLQTMTRPMLDEVKIVETLRPENEQEEDLIG